MYFIIIFFFIIIIGKNFIFVVMYLIYFPFISIS